MYDKVAEQKHKKKTVPIHVVWVEVSLKSKALENHLGGGKHLTNLNFNDCYKAYRDLLLEFSPRTVYKFNAAGKSSSTDKILAFAAQQKFTKAGIPLIDYLLKVLRACLNNTQFR